MKSNPLIPNPSHETKQSGRSSARHARNSVYYKRTWNRVMKPGATKKTRVKTVVAHVMSMKPEKIVDHFNRLYVKPRPEPRPECRLEIKRSELPMDNGERFERGSQADELSALIEACIADRPARYRHETVVANGILKTVKHEIPHRPINNIEDFLAAFPSQREAVERICKLN